MFVHVTTLHHFFGKKVTKRWKYFQISICKFLFGRSFFWKVVYFLIHYKMLTLPWRDWISVFIFFKSNCKVAYWNYSSKKRAANVKYLTFCKWKNMPLIWVWQFESWPHWFLEWVRERSLGWIPSFGAWIAAWIVVSPNEVDKGRECRLVQGKDDEESCILDFSSNAYRTSYYYFICNTLKTKLLKQNIMGLFLGFSFQIYFFFLISYLTWHCHLLLI